MERVIYLVCGQEGEYSDREEWVVRAYRDQKKAEQHVVAANARVREWEILEKKEKDKLLEPCNEDFSATGHQDRPGHEGDRGMPCDWMGEWDSQGGRNSYYPPEYYLQEVELVE